MIPVLKLVIKREYSAKLYRLSPFFFSLVTILLLNSFMYALIFTPILYFTIDVYYDFIHFINYFILNFVLFTFGQYFGLLIGGSFPENISFVISPVFFIIFMLGSGFFKGNSTLPSYISWFLHISPYKYFIELTLKNFCDAKEITKDIPEILGYTFGVDVCIYILLGWITVVLILAFLGFKFYTAKF